jgi:hypothetical protein
MPSTIETDAIRTLPDRYAPRFEVFFAKPSPPPTIGPAESIQEPDAALQREKSRLDGSIFIQTSDGAQPKLNQLLPLAGPWGEKRGQRTDDILSVAFTESVGKNMPLAQVTIELVNVYDPVRKFFRYTDIPPNLEANQAGVFPLIDYGDTIAVRFGYPPLLDWAFDGIISKLTVSFPADGESRVNITAVDKRDRLRNKKKFDAKALGAATEQEIIRQIARVGELRVASPSQPAFLSSKGSKKVRSRDQDALQFITDRANKAPLELLCFGNTLFVLPKGDKVEATEALVYSYRNGLTSFEPTFSGAGIATRVRVEANNKDTGEKFVAEVSAKDLAAEGLIPPLEAEGTALDKVEKSGQGGEKIEVVTNYAAQTAEQTRRIAIGILKRNLDGTFTASGNVIGDPRIRARTTLKIVGVGRFSGFYYVESVTHRLGPNGYQTEFTARRNQALSQRGASSNQTSSPAPGPRSQA